jgi:hypothetical protein
MVGPSKKPTTHESQNRHSDVGLLAGQKNLRTVEVATISHDIEMVSAKNLLCSRLIAGDNLGRLHWLEVLD